MLEYDFMGQYQEEEIAKSKGCHKYGVVYTAWCNKECPERQPSHWKSKLGDDGLPNGVCIHEKYGKLHSPAYFKDCTNLRKIGMKVKRVA